MILHQGGAGERRRLRVLPLDSDPAVTQRSGGNIYLSVRVQSTGDGAAYLPRLDAATLNGTAATSGIASPYYTTMGGPLPFTISSGSLLPGNSNVFQVVFPASLGLPGTRAVLRVSSDYTGGSFVSTLRVTLP